VFDFLVEVDGLGFGVLFVLVDLEICSLIMYFDQSLVSFFKGTG
jgi:hypothetical protein